MRTKFGAVLSIIIALALLAFIFSLRTDMGFSGNDPRVGVVNGTKINHSEFYNEYEKLKSQYDTQDGSEQNAAMLTNATWQSLIFQYVMQPGFDKLGIAIPDGERKAMFRGEVPTQTFYGAFGDQRTGTYNVGAIDQLLYFAGLNPDPNDQQAVAQHQWAKQKWNQLNEQARMEREMTKYSALVGNGVYVNELEVALGVDAANKTYSGKVAGKKYLEVADSLMQVSSGDIKSYYKSHKGAFKQIPSRSISYVVFEVSPTDNDMLEIEKTATEVGAEFAEAADLKTFVRANRNGKIAENYVNAAQLTSDEAEELMAGKTYGPVLKNNQWTMSRVLDSKIVPDSIGLNHIELPFAETALADSLMTVLKKGADFAQLAAQYSSSDATAANGGNIGVVPFSTLNTEFANALSNVKKGDIVQIPMGNTIQLLQVYRADKPSKHIQIASIVYPVEASTATRREIHNQASTFTVKAKGSVEAFNNAAAEAAVTPRVASISQGERVIRGLEDSRDVVRWADGAKKKDMSEIFTVGKDYVVATLTEIDDNKYTPIEKVSSQIRTQVLRDKKYDYIVKELSGTTIDQQAASLGSEVSDFADLSYNAYAVQGAGIEPRLVGAITTTTEESVLSAPVKGFSGVYVYEVNDIKTSDNITSEGEQVRAQATIENFVMQNAMQAIVEMAKIQDLTGKYL